MTIGSVRHALALQSAKQKILRSKLSLYAKELYLYGSAARGEVRWDSDIDLLLVLDPSQKNSRELKREIIYLKGSLTDEEVDAPEVDLKVVFGNGWRTSTQTYYKNIVQEGKKIWQKNYLIDGKIGSSIIKFSKWIVFYDKISR